MAKSKEQKEYDKLMKKLEKQQKDLQTQAELDAFLSNHSNSRSTHY